MNQSGHTTGEIAGLAQRILDLCSESDLPPISAETAKEVAKKEAAGICLNCEEKKGGRYKRGLCDPCYQSARRLDKSGDLRFSEMERLGLIAPAGTGGRPPKLPGRFADVLAEKKRKPAKPANTQKATDAIDKAKRAGSRAS